MFLAADEVDGMNQLFGIRIVEQEREALDGFVGESAAAGFFPGEVLVKEIYFVTGAGELLAAHCAGGPAANNCNFGHTCVRTLRVFGDGEEASEPSHVKTRNTGVRGTPHP